MLVAPGDSRQGTAGAKISGRDHDVSVSAKQKHVKKNQKKTFESKMWSAVDYDAFNLYFKGTVQGNQHKISGTFERVVSNTLAGRIVARSSVFETPAVETFVFSSSETIVLPFLAVLEQQQLFAIQLLCKWPQFRDQVWSSKPLRAKPYMLNPVLILSALDCSF